MKQAKWLAVAALAAAPAFAKADNWACEVVLCLSNPKGATAVAECVPPIKKLWKQLAKGKGFPYCDMSGGGSTPGNSVSNQWASGYNCPSGYQYWGGANGDELMCEFSGVVTVKIANQPYTRVWWNEGASLTEDYSQGLTLPTAPAVAHPDASVSPAAAGGK